MAVRKMLPSKLFWVYFAAFTSVVTLLALVQTKKRDFMKVYYSDILDFDCSVPAEQRLRSGCWVSGKRGAYDGVVNKRYGRRNMELGRSLAGEDLTLVERYFHNQKDGTFLEMGALDGERFSNSWYFEKEMGWRGILIEASPSNYAKLKTKRPDAIKVHAMVCVEDRLLHWVEGKTSAVRGAWELMQDEFKRGWHPNIYKNPKLLKDQPTVPCVRLESILARFGVRHVDLFSLDVEGAELSVLQSINWRQFTASVILLEVRKGSTGVVELLTAAGYVQDDPFRDNLVFLHPKFKASIK